jgi:antitoxin component YwqK of YwqJK toxin-antitoxin module
MKTNKRDKEGNREGLWESYYQGGILRTRGYYKNNIADGYWEYYFTDGRIMDKGNYKNGIIYGYWEFYNYYGSMNRIEYFYK